jgi:hypothetical protein
MNGMKRKGNARDGMERHEKVRHDMERQGNTWNYKA